MTGRLAAVPLTLSLLCSPVIAGDKKPRAEHAAPAPKAPPSSRAAANPKPMQHPARQLDKLLAMSPSERERALSTLPPQRRDNIERRIGEIEKLPPAQQNRVRSRLELLNSLPPQRQSQVRRSMKQFQELPDDRRVLIRREMNRMAQMPDEERRARMNSEEFRNRYSASEQQMMGNLMEIQAEP